VQGGGIKDGGWRVELQSGGGGEPAPQGVAGRPDHAVPGQLVLQFLGEIPRLFVLLGNQSDRLLAVVHPVVDGRQTIGPAKGE
jgi:hypothetical protein